MQTFERPRNARPIESRIQSRLTIGFIAGFTSVWIFSNGMLALLYAAGAPVPFAPWSMAPVPPFGVPRSLSGALWGGLWGVVYAFLEPRLTARLGWWCGGLVFGSVLPLLVLWFVVLPMKGLPIGGGFALPGAPLDIVLHAVFGLGTSIIFRLGARARTCPGGGSRTSIEVWRQAESRTRYQGASHGHDHHR